MFNVHQTFGDEPAARKPIAAEMGAEVESGGKLIRVSLPITGSVDAQVKRAVGRALDHFPKQGERPVLVFEFWPTQNEFGEGSDFGRALELARFLSGRDLSAAKTVAFIPKPIKGHAVLAVMACEEIVMAPDASFGSAGVDEPADEPVGPAVRAAYTQIANARRTIPVEVALGMLDKDAEVLRVETVTSAHYLLREQLAAFRGKENVVKESVLKPAGQFGQFKGRQARENSFAKFLAPDRAALARALAMPQNALEEDPSIDGDWRAVQVHLSGEITPKLIEQIERMVDDQIRQHDANFLLIWIDSPGGSLLHSMNLANYLADLDPAKVRTVAYIPNRALGDAALIALACDQIVMRPEAELGGDGAADLAEGDLDAAVPAMRDRIAPHSGRNWSLSMALVDRRVVIHRYVEKGTGRVELFSAEELASQRDPAAWVEGERITDGRAALAISGDKAESLGVARHVVQDISELRRIYALPDSLALVEPGWADFLIRALAAPGVGWLLLFVGFAALYAELHSPGIGIGGFLAGVCFLLWFWNAHLQGTAGWLEVLLFAAGVGCILLELFILPGVAIFGLGGGLMILASIILASQTFVLPHNAYQIAHLRNTLLSMLAMGVAVICVALLIRRLLPGTPMFSHMVLAPPSEQERESLDHRESLVDYSNLLGQQGVATTQLTPSGKARFGSVVVDVIADGEAVERNASVVVKQVLGNRVVVQSLRPQA